MISSKTTGSIFWLALLLCWVTPFFSDAFSAPATIARRHSFSLKVQSDDETVPVGSEDYYKGFLSRSLDEEPVERVTGDAILGPTLKFVGGFAAALVALTVGFMASNGLL
jgi:hypothetical protein